MDEIGYYEFEKAIQSTGLKPFVLEEICKNAKAKGSAYLSKDNKWMLHSSVVNDLIVILSGKKDSTLLNKKQ